jgi:hypothetical protein
VDKSTQEVPNGRLYDGTEMGKQFARLAMWKYLLAKKYNLQSSLGRMKDGGFSIVRLRRAVNYRHGKATDHTILTSDLTAP